MEALEVIMQLKLESVCFQKGKCSAGRATLGISINSEYSALNSLLVRITLHSLIIMKFATITIFAAATLAANETLTETITTCGENSSNETVSTYSGAAAGYANAYAAGAAALAAGALLL